MTEQQQPELLTPRLLLRPFTLTDAPDVRRLAGDWKIADTTLSIPHPYGNGVAEEWIGSHAPRFEAGTLATFAVTDKASCQLLGTVGLSINADHAIGELGYWIGVPYWGQGYATESVSRLVDFGFEKLQLHRIQGRHLVRNPASGRVMQKAGMILEGVLRKSIRKWHVYEDVAMYAILVEEWRQ